MFRNIFTKYFSIVSAVILISFLLAGVLQIVLFRVYWINDKEELLHETSVRMAERTAKKVTRDKANPENFYLEPEIQSIIDMVSGTIDGNVYIVKNTGELYISSSDTTKIFNQETILPDEFKEKIKKGQVITDKGSLGGFLSHSHYTVGVPIIHEDTEQIGYIFSSVSTRGLYAQTSSNVQIIFLCMVGVLIITFVCIYIITYRLVRPLREMASATRLYGMGDFSYRVPVRGQDEVAELAIALNTMVSSLSTVEDVRRNFIANVSHELKTPMTTISGFIDGVLDGTIPKDKHEHYLNLVSDEIKRLSRLVTSMLELSRIDNNELRVKFVPFDLTGLVCHTLLTFEQRIEEKNVVVEGLDLAESLMVNSDVDLVGQVVYNLFENAVKFVNNNGVITVMIYHKHNKVYCSVRNTGDGIPASEMPHIFEKFYKSDHSRGLDKKGLGLGLYIVKTLVNMCNGEIFVRSVEGEFCEFEFWLPEYLGK